MKVRLKRMPILAITAMHTRAVTKQAKASGVGASLGTFDGDCASCHLGTASSLLGEALIVHAPEHGRNLSDHDTLYQSHIPIGLERPDRSEPTTAARFGGGVEFCLLQL
jgi:mono/diheme cytochrome c family protein